MNNTKLRGQSIGLLSMLGIQFILGMILNLFIKLPDNPKGLGSAIKHGGGVVLVLHVLIAIGLLIGSISLIARAYAARSKPWLIASIIGALGIIAALTNGFAFVGNNNDVNSFVMALGFLVAATSYSVALSFATHPVETHQLSRDEKAKSFGGRVRHSHS
jgi:divalent metal cation (Fe/Co/Zn/Cd) transporter